MSNGKESHQRHSSRHVLTVVFYVSSHGLGHASRASQVMAALPQEFRIIVKSLAPADFLRSGADSRPLEILREAWDFGAWQESNFAIDWDRTFRTAMRMWEEAQQRLHDEVCFLREEQADVVVTDIPSTPLVAARQAHIPSVCIANFTWIDVFRRAASTPTRRAFLNALRKEYALATIALLPGFALPLPYFPHKRAIPLIAQRGRQRRREMLSELQVSDGRKVVLLYFGGWGLGTFDPRQLRALEDEFVFVSLNKDLLGSRFLDPTHWPFRDIVATVDVVLAKPGYGTMGGCMANATPVVYYPRPEFAEYPALRRELQAWGGCIQIAKHAFQSGQWRNALRQAVALRPEHVPCAGAKVAAETIKQLATQR